VRHGSTAALAAPFKPKDTELFAIISAFDAAYSAYNGYQASIERYWTLRYVQQQGLTELTATVIKDNLVRADELPLVLGAMGAQGLPRGAHVRVKLGEVDEISLDLFSSVIERLDSPADAQAGAQAGEEEDLEGGESELAAGPISIALDMEDAQAEAQAPEAVQASQAPSPGAG
jgi:exoribonuclease-2